jgi:hypothetical protein
MRPKNASSLVFAAASCVMALSPAALANTSNWGATVGAVHSNDSTNFCVPVLTLNGATSSFVHVPSDATQAPSANYIDQLARQRVRVLCTPLLGVPQTVTGAWSSDGTGDASLATCLPGYVPTVAQCVIDGQIDGGPVTTLPYVYKGSTCGTSVASISSASNLMGQLLYSVPSTGFQNYQALPGFPAPNPMPHGAVTGGSSPHVGGGDVGGMFLSSGTLNFFFGDSFDTNPLSNPPPNPPAYWIHGPIAKTTNLDPTALVQSTSGLQAWDMDPSKPGYAVSGLPLAPFELTAIPGAGVGVTDASGNAYRFVWYFSMVNFGDASKGIPFTANWSSLAYSVNGGPWVRGDAANPPTAPKWPAISNFGPGAIWYDRYGQMLYFFGLRPQMQAPPPISVGNLYPFSGIRVARVKSTPSAILDPKQYQYWDGLGHWVADPQANYLAATPQTPPGSGGLFGPAADLIPAAIQARSEISVAFDAYANAFILMVVNLVDGGIRLYQSPTVTGPWSEVLFDTYSLPNTGWTGHSQPAETYAPFTGDQMLGGGGHDVYYTLSEWYQTYNVGLWHFPISVNGASALCN